jgi:hypothetical protein
MIVGYILTGNDNGSCFFDKSDKSLPICKKCGYVTDFDYISPNIKLKVIKYDISSTYDNRTIVSNKFKIFCDDNKFTGVLFHELPKNPEFYKMTISNIIKVDTDKSNLRYYKFCDECGNYESVTPAIPVYLKEVKVPLLDGFYATDIHFASGNEKCPLKIVGVNTYEIMRKQNFKGINFIKMEF